jgi:hypothetical protein
MNAEKNGTNYVSKLSEVQLATLRINNEKYKKKNEENETDAERKLRQNKARKKSRDALKEKQLKIKVEQKVEQNVEQKVREQKVGEQKVELNDCDKLEKKSMEEGDIRLNSARKNSRNVSKMFELMNGYDWDCKDFKWLEDVDQVLNILRTKKHGTKQSVYKESTVKTILSSISALLRDKAGFEKLQSIYSKLSTNSNSMYVEERNLGKLSENEQNKAQNWSQILDMRQRIKNIKDLTLYSIYTEMPPRRSMDYRLMKIVRGMSQTNVMRLDKDYNYISFDSGDNVNIMVINVYKAGALRVHGIYIENKFSKALNKTLRSYRRENKIPSGSFLFPNSKDQNLEMSESTYSEMVKKLFMKYSGIASDVNMLRHSFSSKFFSKYRSINEVINTAHKMGTSSSELKNYVREELVDDAFRG